MRLFSMLHARELKISAFGTYVLAGASPRSRNTLVTHTSKFPMFVMVVNKFLASVCPQHVFTSYVIRQGCFSKVHRDLQNGPTGAAVVALSHEARGEGLWIQDKVGNVPKEHAGGIVMGTIHSLRDPVLFDSRRLTARHAYPRTGSYLWLFRHCMRVPCHGGSEMSCSTWGSNYLRTSKSVM